MRDEGLLDSALAQPWQTFGGRDLYEGDVAKACRLCYSVIRDHPFTDGNKRTGVRVFVLRRDGFRNLLRFGRLHLFIVVVKKENL